MKKILFTVTALAILLVACLKNELVSPSLSLESTEVSTSFPEPNESVTITAVVTDTRNTITSVIIEWSIGGTAQSNIAMTAGANNTFTGVIPGQADGTTAAWRVIATNNKGDIERTTERAITWSEVTIDYSKLRINEVSGVEGAGGTCDIFYELFNTGDKPIDLTGVEIWYNANSAVGQPFPPNDNRLTWKGGASPTQPAGIIEPGGIYLIQGRANCNNGPIQTGLTSSRILIITLRDPGGNQIDQMARAEDNRSPWNFGSNEASMSRIPDGTGPFYFTPAVTERITPGTTNGTDATGLVLVPQTPQP